MEYTSFPQKLIYRQREKLDEFDIKNTKSLNYILESELFKLYYTNAGYKKFAINIFNTVYYICTMILADSDPKRNFGDYMDIIDKKMEGRGDDTALVLSMLLIIIDANKWKETNKELNTFALQIFYEIEKHNHIRYAYYEQAKSHYETRAERTTLYSDNEFKPRPINYKLLADNYSVEDLRNLFANNEVLDFIFTLGKNEEEQHIIASFMEDHMHSFFADSWEDKAFFNSIKSEIHNKFHGEEERAIEDAEFEAQQEEDAINDILIQEAKERIPQLEAEIARLRAELERNNKDTTEEQDSNQPKPSNSDTAQLQVLIKKLQDDLEVEKAKNAKLEEEIAVLCAPVKELSATENVRMAFALQLFRAAGLKEEKLDRRNRQLIKVATLMMLLLDKRSKKKGNEAHTCAKWLSHREYVTSKNKNLIIDINKLFTELDWEFVLSLENPKV